MSLNLILNALMVKLRLTCNLCQARMRLLKFKGIEVFKIYLFSILIMIPFHVLAVEDLGEIKVIGHDQEHGLAEFTTNASRLKGPELIKQRQSTIGDTLSSQAGITSTGFGPNSSRPVIRGLDGPRIRVLQNSLGILDASTQSLDHNIPIDPLLVDQIEIVKGPMALLYGSSAVGGVVNIVTNRTHSEYEEGLLNEFQTQAESVNNGFGSSFRMDYGKKNWMIHLDGATKNIQNQKIPGYARSERLRKSSPLTSGESEAKNKVPNTFNQQNTLGTGVTRFFNQGHVGLSFSNFQNTYGTPAEKDVSINMLQNRFELDGEIKFSGLLKKIEFRSAQTDYRHKEIEHGATGTIFKNFGNESRLDAHHESGIVKGVTGLHSQTFTFKAIGDEAFLPSSENAILSLFSFQKMAYGKNTTSAGARIENSKTKKIESTNFGASDSFGFTNLGASLGQQYQLNLENSFTLNYSYTERSPNFQELLSNGAHLATGTFEEGNQHLQKEKSHALELGYKFEKSQTKYNLNLYAQRFQDYISLNPQGVDDAESGLPVYRYEQMGDSLFYGVDLDGKTKVQSVAKNDLNLITRFDLVRAQDLKTKKSIARISPPRMTLGLELASEAWTSDVETQYVFEQTQTAPNETRTERYMLTNLGTRYAFTKIGSKLELFFRLRNIFDVMARSHTSTLKEISPLPGRNFILGFQWLI